MKVKCISLAPNKQQIEQLGKYYYPGKQEFYLTVGQIYVVFGMQILGGIPWLELASDTNYLFSVPLCLFEIIDARVSQYWEVHMDRDGNLLIWPSSFYRDYYYDDLAEGIKEIVEDFNHVRSLIEAEARRVPGVR